MSTGTDYDLWIRAVIARDDDDDDPSPPKPPKKSPSPTISSSTALPTATQIEGLPIQTLTIVRPPKGGDHLGPGETAGIGIGVALAVLGIALGIWFCVRRRRRKDAAGVLPGTTLRDMEAGEKGMESHSMEFTGVPEMETGTVGARRFSELAGRRSPAEMVSEPHTVVELEGSNVMARYLEKKNRERLFLDPPIDEKEDDPPEDDSPKVDRKKDQW